MIFVLLLIVLFIIVAIVIGYFIFNSVFDYSKKGESETDYDFLDSDKDLMRPTSRALTEFQKPLIEQFNKLEFEEISIISFDNLTLYGYLLRGNPKEVVICVHGYKSSMQSDFCDKIKIYQDRGSSILLLNDRAHGKSEGIYLGFSENDKRDVSRWVDKVNEMFDNPKIYLHGVSMGGATVIHCANMNLKNVAGIIDDCGFDSIVNITKFLMKDVYHLPYFPFGDFAWMWSVIITGISFNTSMGEDCVRESSVPILFVHGKQDHYVPCRMSEMMYKACTTPKELLLVDDCGHAAAFMKASKEYTAAVNRLLDGKFK